MGIETSRRGFLRGIAGVAAIGAAGNVFAIGRGAGGKIRLAAVGVEGKGYSDWSPMVKSGLAELVAWCDADETKRDVAMRQAKKDLPGVDLSKIPFFTDYRRLLEK